MDGQSKAPQTPQKTSTSELGVEEPISETEETLEE